MEPQVKELLKTYSSDELEVVLACRDEIRGIVGQDRAMGYSDYEIEEKMGDYLDEIYDAYYIEAQEEFGMSEEEFRNIYIILESIDGSVDLYC